MEILRLRVCTLVHAPCANKPYLYPLYCSCWSMSWKQGLRNSLAFTDVKEDPLMSSQPAPTSAAAASTFSVSSQPTAAKSIAPPFTSVNFFEECA